MTDSDPNLHDGPTLAEAEAFAAAGTPAGRVADWRAVVTEALRRYRLPNQTDAEVADLVIGALEGHGFAVPGG